MMSLTIAVLILASIAALALYFGSYVSAWDRFSPAITSLSGTLEKAYCDCTYKAYGSTVHVHMTVKIVKNGTGSGGIKVSLPASSKSNTVMMGRDISKGPALQGVVTPAVSPSHVVLFNFDNGYPGGDDKVLFVSGTYEAQ